MFRLSATAGHPRRAVSTNVTPAAHSASNVRLAAHSVAGSGASGTFPGIHQDFPVDNDNDLHVGLAPWIAGVADGLRRVMEQRVLPHNLRTVK
jgi:hypothetical protein